MGALDRVFRSRRPSQERPLAAIVAGLWKNGEQGVWYDVEGFRDSWNQVGPNLTPPTAAVFGEASVVSPGVYRIYSSSGAFSSVNSAAAVIGRRYIVSFNVDSITTLGSGLIIESAENPSITTIGPKSFLVTAVNTSLHIKRGAACDIQISGLSAKEWLGVDKCPLFQDAAGTLPCYLPGQGQVDPPVGLLLDKRLGFALGPERITNTGFQTLDGWTAVRGASATVSSGAVTVTTANPQDWGSVCTPIATEPGKSYLVKVLMTSGNGQNVQLLVSESAVNHVNITNTGGARNAAGYYSLVFKAAKTVHYVWLGASTNTAAVSVSSWAAPSVREISANYAYQTTTTSRPTLSARYNLLTNTNWAGAAVGTPGTPPVGWSFAFNTGSIDAVNPIGDDYSVTLSATANRQVITQGFTAATNTTYSCTFDVIATTGFSLLYMTGFTSAPAGSTITYFVDGVSVSSSYVPTPGQRVELRLAVSTTSGAPFLRIGVGAPGAMTGSVTVARPDIRVSGDGVGLPPYQRIVDASNYDTAGFPPYLRFDGVDDSLLTADIDFSTVSSAIAVSAVRKLSDASRGIVFELGGTGYSSPGSFNQEIMWFSANVSTSYSGATGNATSTYPCIAPFSAVMSSAWNLSAPLQTFRVNGVLRSTSTVAVGGGMFQKAPLFIGRRNNSSVPFNGRLYSLIVRSGATPDATITRIERYLNSKARAY